MSSKHEKQIRDCYVLVSQAFYLAYNRKWSHKRLEVDRYCTDRDLRYVLKFIRSNAEKLHNAPKTILIEK
jgi:hypothetical protein